MSEDTKPSSAFKPTDMSNLDPDSWEEYLRAVIHYSLPKLRTGVSGVSHSYTSDFAIHLLELDMIYISEIRFYSGIEDGIYQHEYFIAHIKSALGREGETFYLSFGRNSVEAAKSPWILGPYVRFRATGDKAETLCKRYGFGEMSELRGKLVGRICFPTPRPSAGARGCFVGSSSPDSSSSSTDSPAQQSLRLDELLITMASIHEKYPSYQDKMDCYWFTAFSFRTLCALKSISYKKGKKLLLVNPNRSESLALYTKHMKKRRVGLEIDYRTDVIAMIGLSDERIKEFEATVDAKRHECRFKSRTSHWR